MIHHLISSKSFGTYWEEKGWSRIGHQLEDLFTRLLDFLEQRGNVSIDIVTNLMQLDYLKAQQFQPRKIWWKNRTQQHTAKQILNALRENPEIAGKQFAEMNPGEKDLYKHTLLTPFSIDFEAYQNGKILSQKGYLLTFFRKNDTPYFATIDEKKLALLDILTD